MGILKDRFVILIIVLGFLARAIFLWIPGLQFDVGVWYAWVDRLVELPFSQFYSEKIWTNYTPGYFYILYFLGIIKSLFGTNNGIFLMVLKLPAILAEIGLGIIVYKKIVTNNSKCAKIAALAIILNPAFIFNSTIWGQIDGLLTLAMVLCIYFLDKKNLILSSFFFGIALLIKPQTLALLPVFIFFIINNFKLRNILKLTLPAFFVVFILSLPFFLNDPLVGVYKLIFKMVGDYPYIFLYAYNFWGIVGFWVPDNTVWLNLSYKTLGLLFLIIFWGIVLLNGRKKLSVYALATLSTLTFYFLPTRVHDRYLYPALVFLIILTTQIKSFRLKLLTVLLSMIHFLNLYFVYVYFNEVSLNNQKFLYNHFIYNFLDNYGREMSLFSTVVFIVICVLIFKNFK